MDEDIKKLKDKYKKKCESLVKANKKIKSLTSKSDQRWTNMHCKNIEHSVLIKLTSHLNIEFYDIEYRYENKIYHERKIESFGVRWMKESLAIHMARKNNIIIYSFDVEIISCKKLY